MGKVILAVLVIGIFVLLLRRSKGNGQTAGFNREQAQQFLEDNKKNVSVHTTASGLQYEILTEGEGERHPAANDRVKVHYHGTLIDGNVFDSSVERGEPITFGLKQVIKGWTEGLQLMVEGDKYRLYIPSELAYGDRGAGKIPPGSMLIFDVELIRINP